jgi:hypothetical protein
MDIIRFIKPFFILKNIIIKKYIHFYKKNSLYFLQYKLFFIYIDNFLSIAKFENPLLWILYDLLNHFLF